MLESHQKDAVRQKGPRCTEFVNFLDFLDEPRCADFIGFLISTLPATLPFFQVQNVKLKIAVDKSNSNFVFQYNLQYTFHQNRKVTNRMKNVYKVLNIINIRSVYFFPLNCSIEL